MNLFPLPYLGLISHFHDAVPLSLLLSVMELRFRLREGINPIVSQVVIIVRICARCQARIWFCFAYFARLCKNISQIQKIRPVSEPYSLHFLSPEYPERAYEDRSPVAAAMRSLDDPALGLGCIDRHTVPE